MSNCYKADTFCQGFPVDELNYLPFVLERTCPMNSPNVTLN